MRALKLLVGVFVLLNLSAAAAITIFGMRDVSRASDAIVVLGNAVTLTGLPSARLRARLDCAASAYGSRLAPIIIVSGGIDPTGQDEALSMAKYLHTKGIPESAIIVDSAGSNTAASAKNASALLGSRGLSSVLVVSQFFHLARSQLAFERAGLSVSGHLHARYYEMRDIYSLQREVIAFPAYLLHFREARKGPNSSARRLPSTPSA